MNEEDFKNFIKTQLEIAKSELKDELKDLRKHYDGEFAINNIEQWLFQLKSAIVEASLCLPPVLTLTRYLNRLSTSGDIMYVMRLLHECWEYAHPNTLLDNPARPIPIEEQLDRALSKYTGSDPANSQDQIVSKPFDASMYLYATHTVGVDRSLHVKYLEELYDVCNPFCLNHSIYLDKSFLTSGGINVPATKFQRMTVFELLMDEKLVYKEDESNFMSAFADSFEAQTAPVRWRPVNHKNGEVNYAKLYVLFKALGADMKQSTLESIARSFVAADGTPILAASIKSRDSKTLQSFERAVQDAMRKSK